MDHKTPQFLLMEKKIDIRLRTLLESYDVHTDLFPKILNGITERDLNHFKKGSNIIQWMIGSQVQLRYDVANWLGIDEQQTAVALFSGNQCVQDKAIYPPLTTFVADWKKISPILRNAIYELDNEELFLFSEKEPGKTGTFFDLLSDIIQRETNCIVHITAWRGFLTYPSTKDDEQI